MLERKDRIVYLDYARCFAILCVVLNHAVNRAYAGDHFAVEFASIPLWSSFLKAFSQVTSRIGVPLFLMITGSLLLERDYETPNDVTRFYRNNIFPLFVTMEIWFFIMFWYKALILENCSWNIFKYVYKCIMTMLFVNQTTMRSMWYMPMILCVYMVIPVISMVKKRLPPIAIIYPSVLVFISGFFVPSFNALLELLSIPHPIGFDIKYSDIFSRYLIYVICGYLISKGSFNKIKLNVVASLFAVTFISSVGVQWFAYSCDTVDYTLGTNYYSVALFIVSVLLFDLIRRICCKPNKIVTYLSRISFGIYFVHICIMEGLKTLPGVKCLDEPSKLAVLFGVSLIGSVIFIQILSNFKIAKRYLFMIKS